MSTFSTLILLCVAPDTIQCDKCVELKIAECMVSLKTSRKPLACECQTTSWPVSQTSKWAKQACSRQEILTNEDATPALVVKDVTLALLSDVTLPAPVPDNETMVVEQDAVLDTNITHASDPPPCRSCRHARSGTGDARSILYSERALRLRFLG